MIKSVQSRQSLKKELDKLGVYAGFFFFFEFKLR